MTALEQYIRLESLGLWRADQAMQRREVLVSFGKSTLIVSDTAERPLSHWSLSAVDRLNAGTVPAIFSPGADSDERLEIDDPQMIDAIEAVRGTLVRAQPKPGRLRQILTVTVLALAGWAALDLGPDALRAQAVTATAPAQQAAFGARILGHMQAQAGPVCRNPRGQAALDRLMLRLEKAELSGRAVVLPSALPGPVRLPGNLTVLGRAVLARFDDPAVAAGELLSAQLQTPQPLDALLSHAGVRATFHLLTTGDLTSDTLRSYARHLLDRSTVPAQEDDLIDSFAAVRIASNTYAEVRTDRGQDAAMLMIAETVPEGGSPPALSDDDWISLQGICDG